MTFYGVPPYDYWIACDYHELILFPHFFRIHGDILNVSSMVVIFIW